MAKRGIVVAGASDLHGQLSHTFPKCDIAALVGDIVPLYSSADDHRPHQEADWVEQKLVRYIKKILKDSGCQFIVITFGNHDICFWDPATRKRVKEALLAIEGVIILDEDQPTAEVLGIQVAGFMYTPTIQSTKWAWNIPRSDVEKWNAVLEYHIPDTTQLLLTHGPPLGILDGSFGGDDHYGSADLMKHILEVVPEVIMCGHAHIARGKRQRYYGIGGERMTAVNVSLCDVDYSVKGSKIQTVEM